jgi:hypothetical protein
LIEVVVAVVLAHVFLLLSCWFIFLLSRFGDIHVYVYTPRSMATQMSKKRKFVADGVFFAELNELLTRELAEDGYSGVEVRVTPMRTEIIIRATRTQNVLGTISAHF